MRRLKEVLILCLASSGLGAGPALAQEARPSAPQAIEPAPGTGGEPAQEPALQDDAFAKPPPGSAADQALWRAARHVDNAIPLSRGEAARLQWRVQQGQFNERLAQLEKQGPPEKAARARKAGEEVIAARDRNREIMIRRWPVDPTRVCSYPLLDFSSALLAGSSRPADKALQDETRKRLQECVDKAEVILRSIGGSNKELAAALATLEAELPPGIPVTGPSGIPPSVAPAPTTSPQTRPAEGM